jgi:aryl-phospho-beta-D-glucosidase BglC (GH1 family)
MSNNALSLGQPASVGVNMEGAEYSWVGYPTLADLQNVKSEGINLVRLPIAWEMMQPTLNGPLSASYLGGLKTFLNNAASLGIGVVVDLHDSGRYDLNWAADAAANDGIEAPNGSDASVLGSAAVPISAFANFWQQLATALQGNPGVAGYDIMNEPNNMPTPQTWPNAAQAAVNAIRTVDMNTPIIVEGDEWASAQYWMSYNANLKITDPANNIIYEAHSYFDNGSGLYSKTYAQQGDTPQTGVQDVAPFLQWLKTNGYRGFVGELGVPSNDPQWIPLLNNVLSDLQANGVSATVWNYEMPDSSPAWWVSKIESTSPANLNIAPVKGVVTPQMALIHSLNGAAADPAPTAAADPAPTVANITASDILWQNTDGQAAIWEMNGTNVIGAANVGSNPGPSWKAIGTGDFNDDGHSDILWQNTDGQAAIWEMNGTNILGEANVGANPGPSWKAIGTGDFNGDGHSDILWQNTDGQASIWEMNGTKVIDEANVGANPGPSWKLIGTGDFNGDGKSDLLWQNTDGQAAIWEMNGTNVNSEADVGANPGPSWNLIGTGDFNGDGKSDLLWQNTSGQASIWEMNGTNVISEADVGANPGASWHAIKA